VILMKCPNTFIVNTLLSKYSSSVKHPFTYSRVCLQVIVPTTTQPKQPRHIGTP